MKFYSMNDFRRLFFQHSISRFLRRLHSFSSLLLLILFYKKKFDVLSNFFQHIEYDHKFSAKM